MINNNAYINKVSKVIFVQPFDMEYKYDDTIALSFPKLKQDGAIDITNGIIKTGVPTKVMIEINIFYTYSNIDTEFAPRYQISIINNDILINNHPNLGTNDSVDTVNNLYILSVIDVANDDKIKIIMSKDTTEISTNVIKIMKNSFINYKTF
jgi:hypothetical protein